MEQTPRTLAPIVTVIVPVSDRHVPLLPDALSSIARQTAQVAQVIVANDSHSPLQLDRYPFRLGVVNTGGGRWSSVARNMALAKVNTPFVTFLDADDGFTNIALEIMLRAYGMWRVGYVYGDAIVMRSGHTSIVPGFDYDRKLVGLRNIHTVTALVPTSYARAVGGFDETLRGWEDWEFYIRLAEAGYCGKRVPYPLITYRLDTGENRNNSFNIQNLIDYIRTRHPRFMKGEFDMGCCGGDKEAQRVAEAYSGSLPVNEDGKVVMEYLGDRQAPVTYNANGRSYRASAPNRFVPVDPRDVARMQELGFQLAPVASQPVKPAEFGKQLEAEPEMPPFSPEPASGDESFAPTEVSESVEPAKKAGRRK